MENANTPPTLDPPVLPTALRAKVVQELYELQAILAYIDSRLENIKQFLNNSNDDLYDGEVLNELEEYGNAWKLCRKKFSVGHAVWHDRVVWHEPEQFSSELNKISLELYTIQRSIQRCVQVPYTLTKWYQEPGYDKQRQKTKTSREYTNYLLSAEDTDTGAEGRISRVEIATRRATFQNQCSKLVAARDKVVNMAAGDSDDALVCCVENTVEDRIMDSGASFHATYCKEELDRFRLRSGKVRLADDKILDIAGVGDVFLKTSFGTSWTLKDVRYIPGLKRRLISVGQLDEEGYHVGFRDQQWIGMSMLASKGNVPDVRKVDIYFCKPGGLGKQKNLSFIMSLKTRKLQRSYGRIVMLKMVPETPLQFGVAERLSRTFRAESTGLRAEAPKMLWTDAVNTAYLIYHIPYVLIGLRILAEEWRWKNTSLAHLKVRRSTRESRAPVRYSLSANYLLLIENGEPESYSEALSSKEFVQWKKAIIEEMVSLKKNQTCSLVRISAGKKASQRLWMFKVKEEQNGRKRDVHQVGDEREVKVLRSFNWPLRELTMEDGVLPERGAIYRTKVCTEVCAGAIYPNNVSIDGVTKMELENSQNNALAKIPMLKLGEYEMFWKSESSKVVLPDPRLCLWELALRKMMRQRRHKRPYWSNNMKTSMLTSLGSLDSIFEQAFKRLVIWDNTVVVWNEQPNFETMGLDDLYNNFKIVEQKVKRTVVANNDDKNLAFLTTSSPSSTNTINTANTGVSTSNTKINTAMK
ncbi:retrovirus-related pol polyprotein from transposon TNT 1-94 [Tanacetum coccineum]